MFEQHYQHRRDLDQIHSQINQLKPTAKMDLLKIWRTANNQFQELDKELVICRRKAKLTSKYYTLEQQLVQMKNTLAKRITFAILL